MVSFAPQPFYPREKRPRYPSDRRLGGLQGRSGWCGEEKNLSLVENLTPTVQPVVRRYADWAIPGPDGGNKHFFTNFRFEDRNAFPENTRWGHSPYRFPGKSRNKSSIASKTCVRERDQQWRWSLRHHQKVPRFHCQHRKGSKIVIPEISSSTLGISYARLPLPSYSRCDVPLKMFFLTKNVKENIEKRVRSR
jgi:hypothetical protein